MGSGEALTPAGILAPADLVDDLQRKVQGTGITNSNFETYDPDGRRRVVLTRDETKVIDRLLIMLAKLGVGMVYCCSQHPEHRFQRDAQDQFVVDQTTNQPILKPGWKPRCLKFIVPEGRDGDDPGYGCDCTRIHIQRQGQARRIR
jgi:hypothetical protein